MLDSIYRHLSKNAPIYLWLLAVMAAFGHYYTISINVSDSLQGTLFLVQKGAKPGKGDLAAFRYKGGGPYKQGSLFLKRVMGASGSVVTAVDRGNGYRDYFVDGRFAGSAKPLSKDGAPLAPGPTGVIQEGHYYMAAPNKDSLDSRYALVGWVSESQIIGRGIKVF